MKRALIVIATLVASLFMAAPAHADKPCEGFQVPELEGVCLTQAQYDYLVGLRLDSERLVVVEEQNAYLRDVNRLINSQYRDALDDIWALRIKVDTWRTRAQIRAGKIDALRIQVRSLERVIREMGTFTC